MALAPAAAGAATRGGSVTFLAAGDVDFIDPGLTYYTFGYGIQSAVNRSLYGYAPGSVQLRPDLASGPAAVSSDRRTVTVHLRSGVRYAPPVGREAVAADVKYAIERAFWSHVPSGYATAYFSVIQDAPRHVVSRLPSIGGIRTPDAHTLVFRLRRPVGVAFTRLLALPITVPVPREHAGRFDRRYPSSYDQHVAFTGPYRVASRRPGSSLRLVRNPNWDPTTDFRPAYLDAITVREGQFDITRAARRATRGSHLLCCDSALAPGVRPTASTPSLGTRWVALNTRVRPLGRLLVRRAIIAAIDRRRLAALRSAPLAQHYLPPGIPGHAQASVRGLDFLAHPGGNLRLARRYLRRAHVRPARVRPLLMVGGNALPGRRVTQAVAADVRRLGFRVRLRLVPRDTMFTRYCGIPRARVAICPDVGWFADAIDPENLLRLPFDSREIRPAGNINWSQLRVPRIDRAIDRASVKEGAARTRAFARIDRLIAAAAPGAPYSWDRSSGYASRDVDGALNPLSQIWDLSFTGLR